jgi:hypothetical protein
MKLRALGLETVIALIGTPAAANPDLIGCFAGQPNAEVWFRITQAPSGYLITYARGTRSFPMRAPSTGDLQDAAVDLGLESGAQVEFGLISEDEIVVRLSRDMSWNTLRSRYAIVDFDFGPAPVFKVACR